MTDDDTKNLTDGEKLNLILSELRELKATTSSLAAQVQKLQERIKESKRRDDKPSSDEWLDYRDAAEMMRCPKDYYRIRDGLGDYKYWPQIERWQPGGRRSRLYVRREHVEAWIEASRTPPPSPINRNPTGIGYEGAVPTLLKLRAYSVMKGFGLEQYIPADATNQTARKKRSAK